MLLAFINTWDAHLHTWAADLGWPTEAMLRLILAMCAGGIVGLEREIRGRQAGFRTNMLVCIGSALAMIVSVSFTLTTWQKLANTNINVDPARVAYGVMTGIGFIGAGTILHTKGSVHGLTTAAGLWCVSAIGLSAGLGLYSICIFAALLVVLVFSLFDYVESALPKFKYRIVTLRMDYHPDSVDQAVALFRKAGMHVAEMGFQRVDNLPQIDIELRISFMNEQPYRDLQKQLEADNKYQLLGVREL